MDSSFIMKLQAKDWSCENRNAMENVEDLMEAGGICANDLHNHDVIQEWLNLKRA